MSFSNFRTYSLKILYVSFAFVNAQSCPTLRPPRTVACQAPLSMSISSQGYWTGLLFPSPGNLPNPKIVSHNDNYTSYSHYYNYFCAQSQNSWQILCWEGWWLYLLAVTSHMMRLGTEVLHSIFPNVEQNTSSYLSFHWATRGSKPTASHTVHGTCFDTNNGLVPHCHLNSLYGQA